MKLWEAIKELTEDPTKEFTDGHGNCLKYTVDGLLAWHRLSGELCGLYTFNRNDNTDWQLVRQPVTWQEAIQAWADGKKVVWEEDGERRVFDRNKSWAIPKYQNHLLDQDGDAVTVRMISGGKWYVED